MGCQCAATNMEMKDQRPDLVDHPNDQRAYSSVQALLLDGFKSTTCAIKLVQSIRPQQRSGY